MNQNYNFGVWSPIEQTWFTFAWTKSRLFHGWIEHRTYGLPNSRRSINSFTERNTDNLLTQRAICCYKNPNKGISICFFIKCPIWTYLLLTSQLVDQLNQCDWTYNNLKNWEMDILGNALSPFQNPAIDAPHPAYFPNVRVANLVAWRWFDKPNVLGSNPCMVKTGVETGIVSPLREMFDGFHIILECYKCAIPGVW